MLQRIQTIYIIVFAILLFASPFFVFIQFDVKHTVIQNELNVNINSDNSNNDLNEDEKLYVELKQMSFLPTGLKGDKIILPSDYAFPKYTILGYLVAVSFSILMLLYLIIFLTMSYMLVESYNMKLVLDDQENVEILNEVYHVGFYMLISSIPFLFLANRGIKKDDDLVKSLDRLR